MYPSIITLLITIIALCSSRTIQWRGNGVLWNDPDNWDCGCLPTSGDDVIINLASSSANVRVGGTTPSECRTLTVGSANNQLSHTLTVSGTLKIMSGGTLFANSFIIVETGPNLPLSTDEIFNIYGTGFTFVAGAVAGSGKFVVQKDANLNFTGAAQKDINGNIIVEGTASVASATGSQILITSSGKLSVTGLFEVKTQLTIINNGAVDIDDFKFTTRSSQDNLLFQGPISINSWTMSNGKATVNGNLKAQKLATGSAATISLIGGPGLQRNFGAATGVGVIEVTGGTNTFNSSMVSTMVVKSGNLTVLSGNVNFMTITGGNIINSKITITSLTLNNAQIQSSVLTASSLTLNGDIQLKASNLSFQNSGQVAGASNLNFNDGSNIIVGPGASMAHANKLTLSNPNNDARSSLQVDGTWSSASVLQSFSVQLTGRGTYILSSSATFNSVNADITVSAINSNGGTVNIQQGVASVQKISGSGSFFVSPKSFFCPDIKAFYFQLDQNNATFGIGEITTYRSNNGLTLITNQVSFRTFDFIAGTAAGIANSNSTLKVGQLNFVQTPAKTIQNLRISAAFVNIECLSAGQCAIFSVNSKVTGGSQ